MLFKKSNSEDHKLRMNIGLMFSSTVLSQLISILAIPILSRIFSPSSLGYYNVMLSYISIITIFSTFRYEVALSIESRMNIRNLMYFTLKKMLFVFSVVIGFLFLFAYYLDFTYLKNFGLVNISLVGFLVYFSSLFNINRYYYSKNSNFNLISKSIFSQSLIRNLLQIFSGTISALNASGLLIGELFGKIGSNLFFSLKRLTEYRYSFSRAYKVLRSYRAYPFTVLPSSILDVASTLMLIPLISYTFNSDITGQVSMVIRTLAIPVNLISMSYADIFQQRIQNIQKSNREIMKVFLDSSKILVVISFFLVFVILFFSNFLYTNFLGSNWVDASRYSKIIVFWTCAQLIVSPLTRIVFVFSAQKVKLIYDFLVFFNLGIIFLITNYLEFSITVTLYTLTFTNVLLYIIYFLLLIKIIRTKCVE